MGVHSRFDYTQTQQTQQMQQKHEPLRLSLGGSPVACEPAYITSWESAKLCAPPGLVQDDGFAPVPRPCTETPEDLGLNLQQLPSKVCYGLPRRGMGDAVGNLLKEAAADPQPECKWQCNPVNNWAWNAYQGYQPFNPDILPGTSQKPKRNQKGQQKRRCFLLIATQLRQLEDEDPRKLLVVRKINRLGFDSAEILQEHFGQYGTVSKVLLSNKHEKQPNTPFPVRLRPSGIGYMLFESVEGAARALAEGATQVVNGVEISVRAFEKRRMSDVSNTSDADDCATADSGSSTPKNTNDENICIKL